MPVFEGYDVRASIEAISLNTQAPEKRIKSGWRNFFTAPIREFKYTGQKFTAFLYKEKCMIIVLPFKTLGFGDM
jgi:hypothetical protein